MTDTPLTDEIDRLKALNAELVEVIKLALSCEPEDYDIWHGDARAALAKAKAKGEIG